MGKRFDYVIVGAGSAGCVLAGRLSEDPDVSVLLIEAGGWDRGPYIRIPLAWGRLFARRYFDWMYDTQPEPQLDGRSIECARGKVVGGSSSTNGMAYGRGHPSDYEAWKASGLTGWGYADVLPYFRKSERWEGGANRWRGGDGPLDTRRNGLDDPLVEAWVEAGSALQYPLNDDYNGPTQEVAARREVILSGGVINSPHLLSLSGVGDGDHLRGIGVTPVAHVPGVGKNLHDHMTIGLEYERKGIGPFLKNLRYDRFFAMVAQAVLKGTGMATSLPMGTKAFVRSDVSGESCDLTLLFRAAPANPQQYALRPGTDGFGYRVLLMKPESRGEVRTVSADPKAAPHIKQNFLTAERDWKALRAGFRLARRLSEHPAVARFIARETLPGPAVQTDAEIDAHIRRHASTAHHPVGTCKMAPDSDPMGVVDAQLRVRGTQALRVVDASVMPEIVSGPPNAVVIMIAEKAADLIGSAGRGTKP